MILPSEDFIRVSCIGMCRIRNAEDRYLLSVNTNRQQIGQVVLTPIGGAYMFDADAPITAWKPLFTEEQTHELRFFIPRTFLPQVSAWFYSRTQRETDPFRELREELVDEYGLIDTLSRTDVTFRHYRTLEYERQTMRSGQSEVMTHYLIELFDVGFLSPSIQKRLNDDLSDTEFEWTSREDIERKVNTAGTRGIDAMLLLGDPD